MAPSASSRGAVLVTGGAGFIGSNLVDALVAQGRTVRVLDDLSTGRRENVHPDAELFVGEVSDTAIVQSAVDGCDVLFHEAAHRAVLRSVEDPLATDTANVHGTLTVLDAAQRAGVRRVVYASSSSVYGGAEMRPTPETAPLLPRSPYAVTKLTGEHYCRVFAELHGLETVALRYFNVFGPRQRPDSMYAAVIPLFIAALRAHEPPTVHGDGAQSRDFTYIDDVVAANLAAADAPSDRVSGRAFNIACGDEHSLLELLEELGRLLDVSVPANHVAPRAGDVRHSRADVGAAASDLGWKATVSFADGLARTVAWLGG
jgi:UDP-glucose 4-epimerase